MVKRWAAIVSLVFGMLWLSTASALAACSPDQIDLVEYWAPSGGSSLTLNYCSTIDDVAEGLTAGGSKLMPDWLWQAYKDQGAQGDVGFLVDAGTNEDGLPQYYVYSYDEDHVYFLEDQVWGNMFCSNGRSAFYRVFDRNTKAWGVAYPRCVADGETFATQEQSVAYEKQTYLSELQALRSEESGSLPEPVECSNIYAGEATSRKVIRTVATGEPGAPQCVGDTISFETFSGAGGGEKIFLSKGLGLTGFLHEVNGTVDFQSVYQPASCDQELNLLCAVSNNRIDLTGKKPVFIFPQTTDLTEWKKYLANTHAYCAPTQVNWPETTGEAPPLANCTPSGDVDPLNAGANNGNNICDPTEYPAVEYQENYNLQNFTLPLFRDQNGDISIESDLSRVSPTDTLAQAAKRLSRSDYAPQFYLSSPQLQCLNAARYLQYVNQTCAEYEEDPTACLAKQDFELEDGTEMTWDSAVTYLTEARCLDTEQDITGDSVLAKLIRSISPETPQMFKMGFLVQYNTMFSSKDPLRSGQYLIKRLAAWLKNDPRPEDPQQGEAVTIVPVWYQSGITANEFTADQIRSYPIDPTNPQETDEINVDNSNFSGPLWKTYQPVLPLNVQERIYQEKAEIVKETYDLLNIFENPPNPLDNLTVSFRGKEYTTSGMLPCTNWQCIACRVGEKSLCTEEAIDQLEAMAFSFPNPFRRQITQSDDTEVSVAGMNFLTQLEKLVVARVNSGVQKTWPYTNGQPPRENASFGPLSERIFNPIDGCWIDQENKHLGESEQAENINYNAEQQLEPEGEENASRPSLITTISNVFRGKITWGTPDGPEQQLHQSRTYLILPDESIDIDVAQAYITPMFLSPEMYDSIMKGENPIYPWKETNPDAEYLSAFLRTSGYDRQHFSEEEGYAQYRQKTTRYQEICEALPDTASATTRIECSCSDTIVQEGSTADSLLFWESYPQEKESQEPTLENGCTKVEYQQVKKSTVTVSGNQPDTNPESNIEVPGKTIALHEFLRRMAFTPHYLSQEYKDLESFYQGARTSLNLPESVQSESLSGYFQELINNLSHAYTNTIPANMCGVMFVDQPSAKEYGDFMKEFFSSDIFVDYLRGSSNPAFLGDCGGQSCIDTMADIAASTPVGNGEYYLNPLALLAVVLEENGRSRSGIEWHYSCNTPAFTNYNLSATVDGLQCTVKNGAGHTVINPVLVALSSQQFFGRTDVVSTCVAPGAVKDVAGQKENTYLDGLGCFITVMQSQFRFGNNDVEAMQSYNYGNPGKLIYDRLQEMATEYSRHAGDDYDREIENRMRALSSNFNARMIQCGMN